MNTKILFTLMAMLTALLVQAQSSTVTLYGFRQQTTGGMQKRGDMDEKGGFTKTTPKPIFKHTIYLASTSKARLYPVQVWVNGKAFSVKTEPVAKLPVMQQNANHPASNENILIPETAGTVLKLIPTTPIADKSKGKANVLVKQNDVVVLYKMSGKPHYAVLKKFTDLDPVALQ